MDASRRQRRPKTGRCNSQSLNNLHYSHFIDWTLMLVLIQLVLFWKKNYYHFFLAFSKTQGVVVCRAYRVNGASASVLAQKAAFFNRR